MMFLVAVVYFSSLLARIVASPVPDARPTASGSFGTVIGTTTSVPSATVGVNKFLGIPFAKSPPLRFAPPEPAPFIQTPLDASQSKSACIQTFIGDEQSQERTKKIFNNPPNGPYPEESEDCLYLNIFSPSGAQGLPVLFWIYGGAFLFGDGSLLFYDGSSFAANQDVIIVTHNYRTNVFGFPNAPEIPTDQQNPGFFDQRMALDWVHTNIAAFGGDPSKITIFGESAGGYSVKQLLAAPPEPLNFRAAIMESQATIPSLGSTFWDPLVAKLGCGSSQDQLSCMRGVSADTIRDTITNNSFLFTPSQNQISLQDTRPAFVSGSAAEVPVLIGTNADEGRVFSYILGLDDPLANVTAALSTFVPPAIVDIVKAAMPALQAPYYAASYALTNLLFHCATKELSDQLALSGYSVWRYLFEGAFPNTQVFPDAGAYHTTEIPEVFGTYGILGNPTADQASLSKYMQKAWADFAKDPSNGPGWAQYSAGVVASLGGSANSGGESSEMAALVDVDCALPDPLTVITGL